MVEKLFRDIDSIHGISASGVLIYVGRRYSIFLVFLAALVLHTFSTSQWNDEFVKCETCMFFQKRCGSYKVHKGNRVGVAQAIQDAWQRIFSPCYVILRISLRWGGKIVILN